MEKNSLIYVAGHQGLVGSALVRALERHGHTDILTADLAALDLTRQRDVEAFFETHRPDYVFVAAAKVGGIWANDTYPADFIGDNLLIQTHVIQSAHRFGAKKLLFLGSSCIYPRDCPQPMKEEYLLTGPLEPTNEWYAVAKIAGIKLGQALRRQHGFSAISVMPTNLFGPGDNFHLMNSHVLPAMIRKFHLAKLAAAGEVEAIAADEAVFGAIPDDIRASLAAIAQDAGHDPGPLAMAGVAEVPGVVLWGTGSPRREFLFVDDLAEACLFLMDHYDAEPFINIGTGRDCTIAELADMACRAVGFDGKVVWDTTKPDGTPQKLLDVSRLTDLGWQPATGLLEGMKKTYSWYLDRLRTAQPG